MAYLNDVSLESDYLQDITLDSEDLLDVTLESTDDMLEQNSLDSTFVSPECGSETDGDSHSPLVSPSSTAVPSQFPLDSALPNHGMQPSLLP